MEWKPVGDGWGESCISPGEGLICQPKLVFRACASPPPSPGETHCATGQVQVSLPIALRLFPPFSAFLQLPLHDPWQGTHPPPPAHVRRGRRGRARPPPSWASSPSCCGSAPSPPSSATCCCPPPGLGRPPTPYLHQVSVGSGQGGEGGSDHPTGAAGVRTPPGTKIICFYRFVKKNDLKMLFWGTF